MRHINRTAAVAVASIALFAIAGSPPAIGATLFSNRNWQLTSASHPSGVPTILIENLRDGSKHYPRIGGSPGHESINYDNPEALPISIRDTARRLLIPIYHQHLDQQARVGLSQLSPRIRYRRNRSRLRRM